MKDFEKFDLYKKGETITSDNTLSPTPTPKEEPKCPTCGKPYKSSDPIFCSNSFHAAPSEEVKQNWISVKDQSPEVNQWVLGFILEYDFEDRRIIGQDISVVSRNHEGDWFENAGDVIDYAEVTHWMPLPKPPVLE